MNGNVGLSGMQGGSELTDARIAAQKIAECVRSSDCLASFSEYLTHLAMERFRADGAALMVCNEYEGVLKVQSISGFIVPPYKLDDNVVRTKRGVHLNFSHATFSLDEKSNVFACAFSEGKDINISYLEEDVDEEADFLRKGFYYLSILHENDKPFMLLCLYRAAEKAPFGEDEASAVRSFSSAIDLSLPILKSFLEEKEHLELLKEAEVALRYQKKLCFSSPFRSEGLSIGRFIEFNEAVCTDCIGVLHPREGVLKAFMIDAVGKGMTGFNTLLMIRSMLRLLSYSSNSPETVLHYINQVLTREESQDEHFASVVLFSYNKEEKMMRLASGGLIKAYLMRKNGSVESLVEESVPLGIKKESVYKGREIAYREGDIFFTASDGLVEAMNKDGIQYTECRLLEAVNSYRELSGGKIALSVKADLKDFCGEKKQFDDESLLVIKVEEVENGAKDS